MPTGSSSYAKLATEKNNPHSRFIDRVSIAQAISIINKEDRKVPGAVARERRSLERAVRLIVTSLRRGGRVFFVGAGTSGRLGVLEAAECPPTFNTPRSLVQAFMAGGNSSVFASKEGAEDRGADAVRIVRKKIRPGDVVIGIAASGVTAFVNEALRASRKKKAETILVTCNPNVSRSLARVTIAINTGPEVIAGSTRLKAATATKLVLNTLTVVSMIQIGKVLGNRMVDLQPKSKKLRARAIGLIRYFSHASEKQAASVFEKSGRSVKISVLMLNKKMTAREASRLLDRANGRLHVALRSRE